MYEILVLTPVVETVAGGEGPRDRVKEMKGIIRVACDCLRETSQFGKNLKNVLHV